MILGICDLEAVQNVLGIVAIIIKIIQISVPVFLLVTGATLYLKTMKDKDVDLPKANKIFVKKCIAAIIIFFIPMFVGLIVRLTGSSLENCFDTSSPTSGYRGGSGSGDSSSVESRMEKYVSKAEETLSMSDYSTAILQLNNVSDPTLKNKYAMRLAEVKKKIDENANKIGIGHKGGSSEFDPTDYGNFSCKVTKKNGDTYAYAICAPADTSSTLPAIVWLHGSGEVGYNSDSFLSTGLLNVIKNWSSSGLNNFGAIIIAPILPSGDWGGKQEKVKEIIEIAKSEYNINENKIVLMGHSLGGNGVDQIAPKLSEYFSAVVMLSGYHNSPSDSEYFTNIPLKGYSDSGCKSNMTSFFSKTNHSEDLKHLTCSHGAVPSTAMREDADGDKVSDLVYWMFSQNK